MWVDPRSLSLRINRVVLKYAASFLNAKIEIISTGERTSVNNTIAEKVAIEYDGPLDLLRIFKIKLHKKPTYSFVDVRILADISEKIKNPLPVGFIVNEIEYIILINWPSKVGTNSVDMAILLAKELSLRNKVIWIDDKGILEPLYNGFEEIDGFPLNELVPGKLEDLAFEIAKIYNIKGKEIDVLNVLRGEDLLGDSEISLLPQMDEIIQRWKILTRDEDLPKLAYLDAIGLPKRAFQVLFKAVSLSDVIPIIASDEVYSGLSDGFIYLTDNKRDFDYFIEEDENGNFKLIRRLRWRNEEVIIEENFEPLWKLA